MCMQYSGNGLFSSSAADGSAGSLKSRLVDREVVWLIQLLLIQHCKAI